MPGVSLFVSFLEQRQTSARPPPSAQAASGGRLRSCPGCRERLRKIGGNLVDLVAHRNFVSARANGMPSVQLTKRARSASASRLRASKAASGEPRGTMKKNGTHDIFVPDLVLLVGLVQLQLCFDVAFGNFQARFITAAYQAGPRHLRAQPLFESVRAGAAGGQNLRQFRRVHAHTGRNAAERIVDVRSCRVDADSAWPHAPPESRRSGRRSLPGAPAPCACSFP